MLFFKFVTISKKLTASKEEKSNLYPQTDPLREEMP